MIELQGKFASAKVFTDAVDEESIAQVQSLLDQPYAEESRIRMMPDIHAGAGCTIGTTMTVGDKICPNLVGVDIGCGMETILIKERHIEPEKLDVVIHGLGWFCVSGDFQEVRVWVNRNVNVTFRKAMI